MKSFFNISFSTHFNLHSRKLSFISGCATALPFIHSRKDSNYKQQANGLNCYLAGAKADLSTDDDAAQQLQQRSQCVLQIVVYLGHVNTKFEFQACILETFLREFVILSNVCAEMLLQITSF